MNIDPLNKKKDSSSFIEICLGKYPGRTIHRIGTALGGLFITTSLINAIWPEPDQVKPQTNNIQLEANILGIDYEPITILVIGSNTSFDKNNMQTKNIKIQSLMLLNLNRKGPITIFQVPTEQEIILPGEHFPRKLSDSYRIGNIALMTDLVSKIVGIPRKQIQGYLLIDSSSLNTFNEVISGINIKEKKPLEISHSGNKSYGYPTSSQQTHTYEDLEKIALYRPEHFKEKDWSQLTILIINAISKHMQLDKGPEIITTLMENVSDEIMTNLTRNELVALTNASISINKDPVLIQLELLPTIKFNSPK